MSYLKRTFILLIGLVLLSAGCAMPGPLGGPTTLKLALIPVTDVVPFYVAQQEGFYAEEGLEVELVPVASAAERDTLLQSGQVDGVLTDLMTSILMNAGEGTKARIVSTARRPFPDVPQFYVMSSPESGITTVEALAGEDIAISQNTVIEYIADRLLTDAGLTREQIIKTNVPRIPVRLELLMNEQVKAAILPDPLASLAKLQGANVVITDSAMPEVSVSVLTFRDAVIQDNPEAIRAVLRAWDRAVAAINANPETYQNVLVENTTVPEPLTDRYTLPPFPEKELPDESQVRDAIEWAREKALIGQSLEYEDVVASEFRR